MSGKSTDFVKKIFPYYIFVNVFIVLVKYILHTHSEIHFTGYFNETRIPSELSPHNVFKYF